MTTRTDDGGDGDEGPGQMAMRVARHDWSATSLGSRDGWSPCLRMIVDTVLASGHAMCLMWGPERTFLYNDAYAAFLGLRHPAALGRTTQAVWSEIWDDIAPLIARTFAGETCTFHEMPLTLTRNGVAEATWWDFSYSPIHDGSGVVAGLLNVASDVTARVAAERERDAALEELRASEAFVRSVLASSTDCIKIVELDGSLSFMNDGGLEIMEVSDFNDVKGCPWPEFLKDDGTALARDALDAARAGRSVRFVTPADTFAGTPRYWSVSVSPILDAEGRTERILSVSRDVTDLEEAREQQRLLNGELSHRIKNTMSVVQAIANQTIGKVADRDAMKAFGDRLAALAASHDVLTQENWSTARLDQCARAALATFGTERVAIDGPPVEIGPRATLSLSLMLHELATNAVKYGALSVPGGKVSLDWAVRGGGGADDTIELSWQERGGPPAVEPTRKGFGSRIIRLGLIGSGGVRLRYADEGFTMEASAPLRQVQQA